MAAPLSFSVMMGTAILRDVASKAVGKVMMQIEINRKKKVSSWFEYRWKFKGEALEASRLNLDALPFSVKDEPLSGAGYCASEGETVDMVIDQALSVYLVVAEVECE